MDDRRATNALAERLVRLLDASEVSEIAEGHQARVFRVRAADEEVIAKVIDASMTERAEVDVRVGLLATLADLDPGVCRPRRVGGRLVTEIDLDGAVGLLVVLESASGRALDPGDADDARRMGVALRRLHAAMRSFDPVPLPPVHSFRTAPAELLAGLGAAQLLHGDVNCGNMRLGDDGVVRIFDFDDCGYGPPELDVANAVYMVLFDALVDERPERAATFRTAFLDGYRDPSEPSSQIDDLVIDRLLDAGVEVLAGWLDDLSTAPVGVRTSGDEWQATLRSVVARYRAMAR